eukprot:TRINITY_DN91002_c0_g1_i1.p1 TRINITY_DN91002_c0_g1~~TRINITY_DN91002_c0_g1_i1.p1  ORF type:complete len:868 (-),score=330.39 TRINITY_DN91002_c0_g1_i1:165-2768(-)
MGKRKVKKDSKAVVAQKKKKDEKLDAKKKSSLPAGANPYEAFQNRTRHTKVLGERVRGEHKNLQKSRARATAERQRGLLKDKFNEGRSSSFKDSRLGEKEGLTSKESSSVQRLVKLRQRQAKKSFGLGGKDEDLTVGGKKLAELGDDELRGELEEGEDEDYEEDLEADAETNKRRRMEAAKEKAEHAFQLEQLDTDFGDIMGELQFKPSKIERLKQELKNPVKTPIEEPDDYDKAMRMLSRDRRVAASERLKTPEEIAREKAEELAALEKKRLSREAGDDEDEAGGEEDAASGDGDAPIINGIGAEKGDIPEDELDDEEEDAEEGDEGEEEEQEGSESASEADEGAESEAAGEAAEGDDEDDALGEGCLPLVSATELSKLDIMRNEKGEDKLAFKLECPRDADGVAKLLKDRAPRTALKLVQRVRTCTAVALAADNRAKLKAFFVALLEYAIDAASRQDGDMSARGAQLLYALRPVLMELAIENPKEAYDFFAARLRTMGPKTLPRAAELCCLKLVSTLFPVTDFSHPLTSPAALLVEHWSARLAGLGAGLTDLVADALLLWEVLHSFVGPPKRFSTAFFALGAAILESCWASAAAGRAFTAEAAQDVGKLLLRTLRNLAEADPVGAHVAANELVRPSLQRAQAGSANGKKIGAEGKAHAEAIAAELDALITECAASDGREKRAGSAAVAGGLEPLQLYKAAPAQIKMLDPIFHEEGDRPGKGMELSETKRLKKRLNEERRAASRQLARDQAVVQQLAAKKETGRRVARASERTRVHTLMDQEKSMLAKLRTESGGGMDTSLVAYSASKEARKERKRLGGNATADRMGTPKDQGRIPKRNAGPSGGAAAAAAPAPKPKQRKLPSRRI